MEQIEILRQMIDEENYPYFSYEYLQERLSNLGDKSIESLARELCIIKAGIEEIKLGDITIPSPRKHFLQLAQKYRTNMTRTVVRADGT